MNYSLQMNKTNIIGPLPVAQPGKPMQPSAHSATSRIKWAVAFEAEPLRQCFALPPPLPRGGLGSRVKLAGYARGSPTRGAGERSETERLDGRRTDQRSMSLLVIEVINFHSTPFYHTFPLATRLNGRKTAKTGRKVEKMRGNHSAAAPQSQKTLGKNARISKNTITAWM